jgi:NAD(P)-dependent dehydrogenase (short-subunit alcohol dehydrogenase family)
VSETGPLAGRGALVTGVSRRAGIGFAICRRLGAQGASVFAQGFTPHDAEMSWGADPEGAAATLRAELPGRFSYEEIDLADPAGPARCVDAAAAALGHVDILVANHARSSYQGLEDLTAEEIDRSLAVNVRATLLLVQAFAARHDDARPGGRVILFTSGQHAGPMTGELPYIAGKAALHGLTVSLAAHLAPRGILLNTINPGPTDTGWATPEQHAEAAKRMPLGRWGEPDDAARLIAWLVSDDGRWIVGQVLDSEGGFRLGS